MNFKDKLKRCIEIFIDDDWPYRIEAKHEGKVVGAFTFTDYDGRALLEHANVNAAYQRAGIGTEMMRLALDMDTDVLVPNGGWSSSTGHPYYLSSEGAALIQGCLARGILKRSNIAEY
ncbi:GNAT family N-acetyltransferase [Stutzerimonas frequens]|uniref:GNAT family N-acetyltransferase n=1 Tax=Stutzerimonas frequens TaxID=2968969 RepID=UPI0019098646|nr:GNAT family N-acetyltransferase [Stutzerimonas frequens]MBK3870460.1 GNAT family N-acetyltransferase [Stutzerimonas frequens]MBK3908797.1 GNAT family N-acetyltransferase [Stutzerimonas frequens]MBK3929606.1 GNAT family N-acetyltransferase [Stutzerimonas frequens]